MLLLWILVLIIGIAYMAHRRIAPLTTIAVVAVYLLAMGVIGHVPGWLLAILWLLLAAPTALLLLPELRRKLFTAPLFNWFQKTLPPMSQTERDAIDAGTVWWDGQLFSGRPDWNQLLAYPKAQLTEEEQAFIDGPTEELCAMVSDWEIGQAMDLPPQAWSHIKEHGFFALIIPKAYGGKGFSAYAHSQVAMKLATRSGDLASTVMVPKTPSALRNCCCITAPTNNATIICPVWPVAMTSPASHLPGHWQAPMLARCLTPGLSAKASGKAKKCLACV